jgi:hypothetical protein
MILARALIIIKKTVSKDFTAENWIWMKVFSYFNNNSFSIDEVPIILHELNDSAIHFISREQYDRALSLL